MIVRVTAGDGCGTPTIPAGYGERVAWLTIGRARTLVGVLLLVFWMLVVVAGRLNPGYSALHDHVSDLASFGARAPWLGILAIATFGVADLFGARVVGPGSGWAARALVVAGAAAVLIATFRIHCTAGAAGCAVATLEDATWTDTAHAVAVAVNAVAFSAAMLASALGQGAAARSWVWRIVVAGLAVVSLALLSQSLGPDLAGAWQRGWLLCNTVALLLVTAPLRKN